MAGVGFDRVEIDERTASSGPWRRWAATVVLVLGVGLGVLITPSVMAQSELPGDDPAAWLDEASVQARRISGVGEALTQALQTKGALLAHIAVAQETIGEDAAAARNQTLVGLCLRALAHDGEDGWVRAAQAKALRERGRVEAARSALDEIANIDEQAAAWAWVNGETPGIPATQGVGQRFASQQAWFETQQAIRQEAAEVARLGSLRDAQVWVEVLNDPAERAWASLGVAEGLAEALPRATRTEQTQVAPAAEVDTKTEVQAEAAASVSPEVEAQVADDIQTEVVPPIQAQATPDPAVSESALAEEAPDLNAMAVDDIADAPASAELPHAEAEIGPAEDQDRSATAEASPSDVSEASPTAVVAVALPTPPAVVLPDESESESAFTGAEPGELSAGDAATGQAHEPSQAIQSPAIVLPDAEVETDAQADAESHALPTIDSAPEAIATPSEDPAPSPALAAAEPAATTVAEGPVVLPVPASSADPAFDSAEPKAAVGAELLVEQNPEEPPGVMPAPAVIPVVPNLARLADPAELLDTDASPEVMDLNFTTTKGVFTVRVHRKWAPLAADRFAALASAGYYHNQRFFRVVPGFVVQWGIHGYPNVAAAWRSQTLLDEPRTQPNRRGTIAFAAATQPNTRTTQVFINLIDNAFLDDLGFVPFGEIVRGMDVVESLFGGYGETPSTRQRDIQLKGNAFLDAEYPNLDSVISVQFAPAE